MLGLTLPRRLIRHRLVGRVSTHTSGEHALGVMGHGVADFEVLTMCFVPFHCQNPADSHGIGCLSPVVGAVQGRERAVWGAATSRTYQVSMPRGWRALVARISRFSLRASYDCPTTAVCLYDMTFYHYCEDAPPVIRDSVADRCHQGACKIWGPSCHFCGQPGLFCRILCL